MNNIESHHLKQALESIWFLSSVIPKQLWRTVVRSVHGTRTTMLLEKKMPDIVRAESD